MPDGSGARRVNSILVHSGLSVELQLGLYTQQFLWLRESLHFRKAARKAAREVALNLSLLGRFLGGVPVLFPAPADTLLVAV